MKRILTLVCILTAATLTHAAETARSAGFFAAAGPSFAYLGNDFETGAGANITLGVKLRNQHSLEFEASYFNSSLKGWWSIDAKFIPMLGKYRVPFAIDEKLTISVAGAAGGLYEKLDGAWTNRKDGAFLIGGEGAINYAISDRASIGAGITALFATSTDITTSGGITLFHIRASYRF
jgi:hypothetical protein